MTQLPPVVPTQEDATVTLADQLRAATDINACFCIGCGQPDEIELHDPARCPGRDGKLEALPIADALEAYDQSCEEEPDLDDEARALHCAVVAVRQHMEKATAPASKGGEVDALQEALAGLQAERDKSSQVPEHGTWVRGRQCGLDYAIRIVAALAAPAESVGEQRARIDHGASDALGEIVWTCAPAKTVDAESIDTVWSLLIEAGDESPRWTAEKIVAALLTPTESAASDDRVDGYCSYCGIPVEQPAASPTIPSASGAGERGPNGMASAQVEAIATAVMRWRQPHFKHMVAFSTLCEAIELGLAAYPATACLHCAGTGFSGGKVPSDPELCDACQVCFGEGFLPQERADVRGGLTIEDGDFYPITVTVGSNVYVMQHDQQITVGRDTASRLATAILSSLPATPRAEQTGDGI